MPMLPDEIFKNNMPRGHTRIEKSYWTSGTGNSPALRVSANEGRRTHIEEIYYYLFTQSPGTTPFSNPLEIKYPNSEGELITESLVYDELIGRLDPESYYIFLKGTSVLIQIGKIIFPPPVRLVYDNSTNFIEIALSSGSIDADTIIWHIKGWEFNEEDY